MAGITRIQITNTPNGRGSWRFIDSRRCFPAANKIYRDGFAKIGAPLEPSDDELRCTKEEFEAGYDYQLGIDVILKFTSGNTATIQEKFLFTLYRTVTVEYWQDWRTQEPGDWFNMKCQYYFTGYDEKKSGLFNDWIMLDWARVMLATSQGRIRWNEKPNKEDGARASFRYVPFHELPTDTIVMRPTMLQSNCQSEINWPDYKGEYRPTWPRETYEQWLRQGSGTKEQQERYKAAIEWYDRL